MKKPRNLIALLAGGTALLAFAVLIRLADPFDKQTTSNHAGDSWQRAHQQAGEQKRLEREQDARAANDPVYAEALKKEREAEHARQVEAARKEIKAGK